MTLFIVKNLNIPIVVNWINKFKERNWRM